MKVLRFLSDPVNLAIRAGYTFDRDAIQGECLFAVLPESRFGHLVQHKDGRVELVQNHDDDDDDEEDYDRPEHDPSLPPEPYFLFWHSTHRLKDDGLISTRDASFDDYMEGFEEMALSFGDDRPGVDGLYPGRPFESSTELGARYLAFLTEPPRTSPRRAARDNPKYRSSLWTLTRQTWDATDRFAPPTRAGSRFALHVREGAEGQARCASRV